MNAFQITLSSRLKDSPVAKLLGELGIDVRFNALRRGEFVLAGRFGIKYYSRDQFIKAIGSRSFYREILELKREYSDPIIIVEGVDPFHNRRVTLSMMQGAALYASVPNRVPILTTNDELETAQMIFLMAAQTGNSTDWRMASEANATPAAVPVSIDTGDPRLNIIAAIPDIGPSRAAGLLNHFGSLSRFFAAQIKDLKKVEGIGPKRAEKIYAFLNGQKAA